MGGRLRLYKNGQIIIIIILLLLLFRSEMIRRGFKPYPRRNDFPGYMVNPRRIRDEARICMSQDSDGNQRKTIRKLVAGGENRKSWKLIQKTTGFA